MHVVGLANTSQDSPPPVGGPGKFGLCLGACDSEQEAKATKDSLDTIMNAISEIINSWDIGPSKRTVFGMGSGVCVGITTYGDAETPVVTNFAEAHAEDVRRLWSWLR